MMALAMLPPPMKAMVGRDGDAAVGSWDVQGGKQQGHDGSRRDALSSLCGGLPHGVFPVRHQLSCAAAVC